jgi:hypothetical protein
MSLYTIFREKVDLFKPFDIMTYNGFDENDCAVLGEQYCNIQKDDQYCLKNHSNGIIFISIICNDNFELDVFITPVPDDETQFIFEIEMCQLGKWVHDTTRIYSTEEEYFQNSTVTDLKLTMEENMIVFGFIEQLNELISERTKQIG